MERLWYEEDASSVDAEVVHDRDDKAQPVSRRSVVDDCFAPTPKGIYDYLCTRVWKQEEAKKAAAVFAYNALERGVKSNICLVGPTGAGKTHIFRMLQELYPDRIAIVDCSGITCDGWNGRKKWPDLFLSSDIFINGTGKILVLDEADKMLMPHTSSAHENVSKSVQSEGLKILEGTVVRVMVNRMEYRIDTSDISFVLCGAFSDKAEEMAKKDSGSGIGFGASYEKVKPYHKHFTEQDLIDYGAMPELVGRIQRIVPLEPMTRDDYFDMLQSMKGFWDRLGERYKVQVSLSVEMKRKLADEAYESGLGIRGMENRICALLDDAIFEDWDRDVFEF